MGDCIGEMVGDALELHEENPSKVDAITANLPRTPIALIILMVA